MEKTKEQLLKEKRVRQGLITTLTSASVLIGTTFNSSQDILNEFEKPVEPHVKNLNNENILDTNKVSSKSNILKNIIYKIPVNIRLYIFVPLWFLGTGIIYVVEMFLKIITPFAHILTNFVIHLLLMSLVVIICIKLLFPDLPLKKILNKKTLLLIIIGSIALSICDLIMPFIFDKYRLYRNISKLIIGILFLLAILKPFIKKKRNNLYSYEVVSDDMTFEL